MELKEYTIDVKGNLYCINCEIETIVDVVPNGMPCRDMELECEDEIFIVDEIEDLRIIEGKYYEGVIEDIKEALTNDNELTKILNYE